MPKVRLVGRSLARVDGREKVAGLTRYTGDLQLPGLLHARLVVCPHAHARIVGVEKAAAEALPGVVGVFTGQDLPLARRDGASRASSPLAIGRAFFNGHPVVAVVAESEAVAEDAATLVQVAYEELPAVVDPLEAMRPDAPAVRPPGEGTEEELGLHGAVVGGQVAEEPHGRNVSNAVRFWRGNVEQGFRDAEVVVERRYRTAMLHQGYLEPMAAVAAPEGLQGVTVWTSTQALFYTRSEVAQALGLPQHQVRVVAMPIGGGFGGKFGLIEPLVAALARAVGRPVSLVLARSEEFLATTPAPQSVMEVKLGARRTGQLTALQARLIFDSGAYPGAPVGIACTLLGGYYRIPHLDLRGYEVLTHKPGCGAYRAPGAVQATFAIESQIDELANVLGMDPVELRLQNAVEAGDPMPNGRPWPKIGLRACLERLQRHRAGRRRGAARAQPGVRRGTGIAIGGWPGGVEPSSAVCRLNGDGSLTVIVGTVDLTGTNTTLAQIAAETFGLPLGQVQVVNADTESAPYAGASSGSKITYTVGPAVQRAAEDARRQLLAIAADHLEAAPGDLELVDGRIRVRGAPRRAVEIGKLADLSMQFGGKYAPVYGRGSAATTAQAPGFSVHLAEVEVDEETGAARVVDYVAVQDVGRALNPAAIEGQIRGAVAQGLGWAFQERMVYDQDGRLQTASLMDYALPGAERVPKIQPLLVEVPAEHGPFGARGVGEPPVVPSAAALANAVANATGHRFTELPITSQAIAQALRGQADGRG